MLDRLVINTTDHVTNKRFHDLYVVLKVNRPQIENVIWLRFDQHQNQEKLGLGPEINVIETTFYT